MLIIDPSLKSTEGKRQVHNLNYTKNEVNLSILLTRLMHPVDGYNTIVMVLMLYYRIQFLFRGRVKTVGF